MITGGAGFIGSHLVDALVARSAEVHVVDNLASGSRENLPAGAELHELDIRDEALEELAAHQVCARVAGVELQPRIHPSGRAISAAASSTYRSPKARSGGERRRGSRTAWLGPGTS